MPDPVTGLIVGGGALGSAAIQGNAARRASRAQSSAANAGIEEQRRQFDLMQELLKPYVEAGAPALQAQQALLGLSGADAQRSAIQGLENSPMFQSIVNQGEEAMLQRASATGGLRGGNIQGALAQFRPAMLQNQIDQQYARLGGLTALGQNSAVGVGTAGMQTGANIAKLLAKRGAAKAGGIMGQGQALAGLFNMPSQFLGMQMGAGGKAGMGFGGMF